MKYLLYLLCGVCLLSCRDKSAPQTTQPTLEKAAPPTIESISELNLSRQIDGSARALLAKAEEKTDYALAEKLVRDSKHYADQFKDNEKTPSYLFRAGEVARSIGNTEEAINIFRRTYTQFPSNGFAVKALFMEASTFEDDLQQKEKAKKAYQKVIDQYPEDELAEQARQLLKVIDKSPEELIKEFQKNRDK